MLSNFAKKYLIYLALIPVAMGALGFYALLSAPYLGLSFKQDNGKWYISSIDNDGPAAKYPEIVGKEISYIGEWKIEKQDLTKVIHEITKKDNYYHFWAGQKYFSDNIEVGKSVVVSINDNRTLKEHEIIPSTVPLLKVVSSNSMTFFAILSAIILFVGCVVILRKNNDFTAKIFFLVSFGFSLYVITFGILFNRYIFFDFHISVILWIFGYLSLLVIPTILYFSLIFPKHKKIANNRSFVFFLYALMYCVVLFQIFRLSEIEVIFTRILQLVYFVASIPIFIHTYFTLRSSIEKAQIKWVLYGFSMMMTTIAVVIIINLLTGHFLFYLIVLAFALLPFSMAFAIMKYKLMDIDTIFDNTIIYAITIGLLALVDIAVITALSNLKILKFNINEPLSIIISVWLVIFAYVPMRKYVSSIIKRLLKREIYDIDKVALSLSENIIYAQTTESILDKVKETISGTLCPRDTVAVLIDGTTINTHIEYDELITYHKPTLIPDGSDNLLVPVIGRTQHVGYLLLGKKHSDRMYDSEDIKLLSIISNQAGLAIEALRYKEKVGELDKAILMREHEVSKEKEKVSREIHDNAGNVFVQAIMLSDKLKEGVPDTHTNYMDKLQRVLSTGLSEIRDLLWVVEPEQTELGDLVIYLRKKLNTICNNTGLSCSFHKEIEDDNLNINPIIKLNMIRIIQEASTNTIKYAKANRIDVSIIQKGTNIEFIIKDNGVGFDVDNLQSPGYGLDNIKKRCDEMDAELSITSVADEGTKIQINLAIEEKKK